MNVLPNPPHLSGAPWYHFTSHVEKKLKSHRGTPERERAYFAGDQSRARHLNGGKCVSGWEIVMSCL